MVRRKDVPFETAPVIIGDTRVYKTTKVDSVEYEACLAILSAPFECKTHLVDIHEVVVHGRAALIVMERLEPGTKGPEPELAPAHLKEACGQLRALGFTHYDHHRRAESNNVMWDPYTRRYKLIDFDTVERS